MMTTLYPISLKLLLLLLCNLCLSFAWQAGSAIPRARKSALHVVPQSMLDDASVLHLSLAQPTSILNNLLDVFDLDSHPLATALGSYALVTASDMIPFVPCQPLAVALGAKLGLVWAFPICSAGQTTAGLLAFSLARRASDSDLIRDSIQKLDNETLATFYDLQNMTSAEVQDESTILAALIGLRVAPFFPFSAGNYLLGGATSVPLRLYLIATLFGCLGSNFLSTSLGAGTSAVLFS